MDGVDDLAFCEGLVLIAAEVGRAWVLTGVGERVGTGREAGVVVGLVEERVPTRLIGVDGLELTEAELVFKIEVLSLLGMKVEAVEGRDSELLRASLGKLLFSG